MKINTYIRKFIKINLSKDVFYKCLFFLFMVIFIPLTTYSQICDPKIKPVSIWEIAYRQRGDRCEGFYRSQVSVRDIDVVGLIKGNFSFALDKNEVVEISSPFVQDQSVNVRAMGIPIKTYYRMDAKILAGQKLIWPIADVIYPQQLSARRIGVFGWIGDEDNKIYVPLSTVSKVNPSITDDRRIRLYLRTSVNVENVKWRVSDVDNDLCSQFSEWQDTPQPSFRSGQPICITLPLRGSEQMCVEIVVQETNGAHWLRQIARVIVKK